MNPDRCQFLNLRQAPARMNAEETAWYLGFSISEIPVLIASSLLKPLGSPSSNGIKYFATVELERLRSDRAWLGKASNAIITYWRQKNVRKLASYGRKRQGDSPTVPKRGCKLPNQIHRTHVHLE